MKAVTYSILWTLTTLFIPAMPKIQLRRFEPGSSCDPRWFTFGSLQLRTPRPEVTRLIGTVGLLQDVGKNVSIVTQIGREGRWAHFSESNDVCSYVKDKFKSWSIQVQPIRSGCPIQRGRYNVLNVTVNEAHSYSDADYQLHVIARRNGVDLCSATLYFSSQSPTANK